MQKKGFVLTEVVGALAILCVITALCGSQIVKLFTSWQNMQIDVQLFDAGRYMLTKMEREISLNAVKIYVQDNKIQMQTKQGSKEIVIRYNDEVAGLYQDTTTNLGTGTNPLFIRDCLVDNWQVAKIEDKKLRVTFDLTKAGRRKTFARIFYVLNGVVEDEK